MPQSHLQKELGKKRPFDSPSQEAFLNIQRSASVLSAAFESLFKTHDLTASMYNALRILRAGGEQGSMCNQISEQLVSRLPDVTRLVDRLEQAGLARRVRSTTDRRVIFVQITKNGLDVLAKLDAPVLALHDQQLAHLSKKELADLSRLLAKARGGPDGPLCGSG